MKCLGVCGKTMRCLRTWEEVVGPSLSMALPCERALTAHGISVQDEIVPSAHMEALYKEVGGAGNARITWVDFPEAHHNDVYEIASVRYWPAILAFFQQHVPLDGVDGAADGAADGPAPE